MKKYEYKICIISFNSENINLGELELNELTKNGWRIMAIHKTDIYLQEIKSTVPKSLIFLEREINTKK